MSDLNQVQIIGRVGNDPDVRYMPNGDPVANVSIATSERWKDKSGNKQERTEWHKVVFFGGIAGIVEKYVSKGDLLFVQGSLKTRKWEDKNGTERYTTEITVTRDGKMQMLGGKSGVEPERAPKKAARPRTPDPLDPDLDMSFEVDDDIPF